MPHGSTAERRLNDVRDVLAGQYNIEQLLGEGGMSTVYLAERVSDGMALALKVLKREFAVSVVSDRFQQEIQLLQSLAHPNILPLFASEQTADILFYVMPYAREGSLSERLRAKDRLELDEAITITRDVADALDYAHGRDIVHRDIKPGNILFIEGRATLCDFGIARALVKAGGEKLSSSGLVVGTPAYMSPEQAGGYQVDGRSDIYSLACVVYEMLAAEPPFTGRTPQVILARQMRQEPPSLRVVRPDIPQHVEHALKSALAKPPGDRPGTAADFAGLLASAE